VIPHDFFVAFSRLSAFSSIAFDNSCFAFCAKKKVVIERETITIPVIEIIILDFNELNIFIFSFSRMPDYKGFFTPEVA